MREDPTWMNILKEIAVERLFRYYTQPEHRIYLIEFVSRLQVFRTF